MSVTDAYTMYMRRMQNAQSQGLIRNQYPFVIAKASRSYVADAVWDFVNKLKNNPPKNADGTTGSHRVSILSYGSIVYDFGNTFTTNSGIKVTYPSSYSEDRVDGARLCFDGASLDIASNYTLLKTIIYNPYSYGSTRTDEALASARNYINQMNSESSGRDSVAILFTDGVPSSLNTFDTTVANKAISNARSLKSAGTRLYTIGMLNGLNADKVPGTSLANTELTNTNTFLHYVSSNYPNASSMTSAGSGGNAQRGYYTSSQDGNGLIDVLDYILSYATIHTSIPIISDALKIHSYIANEFLVDSANVHVYLQDYLADGTFGDKIDITDRLEEFGVEGPFIGANPNVWTQVAVQWNQAPEEHLRTIPINGSYGKKLILEIPITVDRSVCPGGKTSVFHLSTDVSTSSLDYSAYHSGITYIDVPTALKLFHKSLNLQSYIGIGYTIANRDLGAFDRVYLGVKVGDGEEQFPEPVSLGTAFTYFEVKTYAPQMTETLTATIYGEKDGKTYTSEVTQWTVRDGVMELIENCTEDLKMTLMVDMLKYGAAAQKHFDLNTDVPADGLLTEAHLAYATTKTPELSAEITTASNGADPVSYFYHNLSLESSIELHFMLKLGSYKAEDLIAKVTVNGVEETAAVNPYVGSYAMVQIDTLGCHQLRDTVTVTICDKTTDAPVSATLTCSAEAFAKGMDPAMSELITAMMRYSDAAKAYQN